jgi:hypothetical protein
MYVWFTCFSFVCPPRTAQHGDLSIECAECYYLYGLALFRTAIVEVDSIFGSAIEEIAKKKQQLLDSAARATQEVSSSSSSSADACSSGKDAENAPENVDDPETLQLAWETLDVARVVYSQSDAHQKELAAVLITLGDLSLELGTLVG